MRSLTIFAGLFLLANGQVAVSADAASKPVVIAAVQEKVQAPRPRPASASVAVSQVTRETSVPEGSLEKFGAVGLPQ